MKEASNTSLSTAIPRDRVLGEKIARDVVAKSQEGQTERSCLRTKLGAVVGVGSFVIVGVVLLCVGSSLDCARLVRVLWCRKQLATSVVMIHGFMLCSTMKAPTVGKHNWQNTKIRGRGTTSVLGLCVHRLSASRPSVRGVFFGGTFVGWLCAIGSVLGSCRVRARGGLA